MGNLCGSGFCSASPSSGASRRRVSSNRSEGEILQSANVKSFAFTELRTSTRNFRPDSVLGEGGFGSVFKGWIDENTFAPARPGTGMVIAVKKLNHDGFQGHREWLAEVNYLGQLSHPNLVKLVGYCLEDEQRLLVYEFMPRGSLENHLFRRGSYFQPLSWTLRMKVALGAARGLAFLHSDKDKAKVIYRDFKTSNVLLDSSYNAKLSDFGLAKDGPTGDNSHVSTRVMGTHGYAAPEYLATGHLTAKSDVYSFGVVLLEMLSGRRALDKNRPSGEHNLVEWARPYLTNKRRIFRILDARLGGQYSLAGAQKAAALALQCLSGDARNRPGMAQVVAALEQLQDVPASGGHAEQRTKSASGVCRSRRCPRNGRAAPLARALRTRVSAAPAKSTESSRRALLGLSEPELRPIAVDLGQQGYRGKQLHDLLYKNRAKQIQEFAYVPKVFREALVGAGWSVGRSPVHHAVTASDGTTKILLKLEDNRLVETVGIPVDDKRSSRLTACVSSQVGCPLRCSFCATGKGGFARNLQAHEIVEQVLTIEETFKHRVTNVVFMGMGEPMLNLKQVLEAHRCLNKELKIGQRMMTISTVGVPNTINKLASHKLQSTLGSQTLRETIVPSAKSYPLEALMDDCKNYFLETGRRVSFEYTLLAGINDAKGHAEELAVLLHACGGGYHVNLIPYNPVEGSEYKRPYRKAIQAFVDALESRKITVSVRQTRGLDANAACGQLRNEFQKNPLLESSTPADEPNLLLDSSSSSEPSLVPA